MLFLHDIKYEDNVIVVVLCRQNVERSILILPNPLGDMAQVHIDCRLPEEKEEAEGNMGHRRHGMEKLDAFPFPAANEGTC